MTNNGMRAIKDVLYFRSDISPFLVHLTRKFGERAASGNLEEIIHLQALQASNSLISLASFGMDFSRLKEDPKLSIFFSAISFTETPLNEIFCLVEIGGREVNLEPYGLVFLRERLEKRGVSPVIYLNNELNDKANVIRGLCKLIATDKQTAEQILPLISVFGKKLPPFTHNSPPSGQIDFRWEREWRYPASKGAFKFTSEDIFVGLCPHDEIEHFEALYPGIGFVDPTRNIKWYATKLVAARKRLDIQYSVV